MQKFKINNLECANCAVKIEESLSKLSGVKYVSINYAESAMFIDAESISKVRKVIEQVEPGVSIENYPSEIRLQNIKMDDKQKNQIIKIVIVTLVFISGIIFRNNLQEIANGLGEYVLFLAVYLITGWDVLYNAGKKIIKGNLFDEHFLMSIATLGAIIIGQLPEAAGVMIFYQVGEFLQQLSVKRSRHSIKSLLEIKPDFANVKTEKGERRVRPEEVLLGEAILVKAGEKIPLDGEVMEGISFVDTSPLTGESVPRRVEEGDSILAGYINKTGLLTVRVTKLFKESSISKILELVENASSKKAETEKFITRFSKYYTPAVVTIALLIALIPPILLPDHTFRDWIYRALVILVISCPCALVISIPLGYFGGIGGSSRKGILIKGSNFLDTLTNVKTIVFDKTGTLTKGVFKVTDIVTRNSFSKDEILKYAAIAESNSNHPIAESIREAYGKHPAATLKKYTEIPGYGIEAEIEHHKIIAGNDRLLHQNNIAHTDCNLNESVIHIAVDGIYTGYLIISDELKEDSRHAIEYLRKSGVEKIYMFTGDNSKIAETLSNKLKLDGYFAELLPEEKVSKIESVMRENPGSKVAFVGDGINDAPVLARADVGIAMGALGSDAAIESADIVLMTDTPSKIGTAIRIAKKTRSIVWQNIFFALGVKAFFIILGAVGIATMWEAVFADMGVALVAILNATRVLRN